MPTYDPPLPPLSVSRDIFFANREKLFDTDFLMAQYNEHGPVFHVKIFGLPIAVFMGPEANRFVLASGMKHFNWRDGWPPTFRGLLGESLFVQDGDEHRQKRRLIMPAFHQDALHNYLTTMEEITRRYLTRWSDRQHFSFAAENKQFTFEIASTLLTGSVPGEETEHLSRQFTTMTAGFTTLPLNLPFTSYGRALAARRHLLAFIDRAIQERRHDNRHDALSLLVHTRDENGEGMTNEELQAQTLLMLFAGHETSASMLTSLIRVLAERPDILQKLRDEQASLGLGETLTMQDVARMTYAEQVLKEVERLHPPVPAGFRGVKEDIVFNGYTIPAGWRAVYVIVGAHLDPDVYHDPYTFDPDRFSKARNENNVPYSLVGFGGGSRLCVGYAFAQLEMKIIVSYLVRFHEWTLDPGQNFNDVYEPTRQPKGGMMVTFRRRQDMQQSQPAAEPEMA